MIAAIVLAAFTLYAGPSPADTHNPPTIVSGVEVRSIPVIPTQGDIEKRLKTEGGAIICKRRQVAGTLMQGPRICATNAEWADLRYQDQVSVRIQQSRTPM